MQDTPWEFFVNGVMTRLFLTWGHFDGRTAAIFASSRQLTHLLHGPRVMAIIIEVFRGSDGRRQAFQIQG
jgi:hypothetical protein